jgi:hypothetical protein
VSAFGFSYAGKVGNKESKSFILTGRYRINRIKPNPFIHEGHEGARRETPFCLSSCNFVSFVDYERF